MDSCHPIPTQSSPRFAIEPAFRSAFNGTAVALDEELTLVSRLRRRLDGREALAAADWRATRRSLRAILYAVVTLLPRSSLGRARLETIVPALGGGQQPVLPRRNPRERLVQRRARLQSAGHNDSQRASLSDQS